VRYGLAISEESSSVSTWRIKDRRGGLNALGIGGGATGKGAALLIVDDPIKNRQEAESATVRERAWEGLKTDLMTRLAPVSMVFIVANRWNDDDPCGRIIKINDPASDQYDPEFPQFERINFPAQSDDYITAENPGGWLFPERLSAAWYERQRATLGQYGWAALGMQRPIVGAELMFPSWPARRRGFTEQASGPQTVAQLLGVGEDGFLPKINPADIGMKYSFAAGLDLSGTKRRGNFFVIWARLWNHHTLPVAAFRCERPQDWIDFANKCWANGIHFSVLKVEDNAAQSQVVEMLKIIGRVDNLPWRHTIEPFNTNSSNKPDPLIGLPAIEDRIRLGEIIWPDGEAGRLDLARTNGHKVYAPCAEHWSAFARGFMECARFPQAGCTPDGVMASWFALHGLGAFRPGMPVQGIQRITKEDRSGMNTDIRGGPRQSYKSLFK
jgi:hypothetical protein